MERPQEGDTFMDESLAEFLRHLALEKNASEHTVKSYREDLTQALALFPGISRSGSTISAGLVRGLLRPEAARFSFLMSIPVMIGAGLVGLKDLADLSPGAGLLLPVAVGFVTAAIVGYLCIRWLIGYLNRNSLYGFAAYCVAASLFCLLVAVLR